MPRTVGAVTKNDIAREVAKATGLTIVKSEVAIQAILDSICRAVGAGQRVEMRNFGVFRPRYVREMTSGLNRHSGAPLKIPASVRFSFKVARSIADLKIGGVNYKPVDRSYQIGEKGRGRAK